MSETTLCIVIVAVTMVLFITRAFPMAVTAVLCSLAMGIMLPQCQVICHLFGIWQCSCLYDCRDDDCWRRYFSKPAWLKKMGVAIGKLRIVQNERIFTVVVVTICTFMSAFMSDSGCIAMWMPIIAAVAAGSRGKIRSKMVIMPAGIACIVGGATTLVGSTSQNTANSFLMQTAGYEMGMGVLMLHASCGSLILSWSFTLQRLGIPLLKRP